MLILVGGMIFMKNNQNSTRNINVAVEYFNSDNFESINLLKKMDSKYSKILKPTVTLKVTGVFKKIKLDKMPVKTGFDSFIILNNNSIDLYTAKNKKSSLFFLGYKESILSSKTFIIKSLFDNNSKIIKLKDYKLIKSFKIDNLYDLIFLIKLNTDCSINSVYLHYGDSNKIYLNI